RREIFDAVGVFDSSLLASEDYDVYLRIARTYPICQHDAVVAEYRRHGEGLTDDPLRMLRATLKVLANQRKFTREVEKYERARQKGVAFCRDHYGGRVVEDVLEGLRRGSGRGAALRKMAELARLAPAEAARLARLLFRADKQQVVLPV